MYNTVLKNEDKPRKNEESGKRQRGKSPSDENLDLNKKRKESVFETSGRTSRYSNRSGNSSKNDDKSRKKEESGKIQRGKSSFDTNLNLNKKRKEKVSETYGRTSRDSIQI